MKGACDGCELVALRKDWANEAGHVAQVISLAQERGSDEMLLRAIERLKELRRRIGGGV